MRSNRAVWGKLRYSSPAFSTVCRRIRPRVQWIAVAVPDLASGRDIEWLVDGVLEDVDGVEVDSEVLVLLLPGILPIDFQVLEIEAAAHAHQVLDRYRASRIAWLVPLRDGCRPIQLLHREVTSLDQHPDERRGDALPLGPADLRSVPRETIRVALSDDLSSMNHYQGSRVLWLVHGPLEGGLKRRRVGPLPLGSGGADVPRGPGGFLRVGDVSRDHDRSVVHVVVSIDEKTASLIAEIFRDAGGPSRRLNARGHGVRVDAVDEIVLPAEVAKTSHVLGDDLLRVAFRSRPTTNVPEHR